MSGRNFAVPTAERLEMVKKKLTLKLASRILRKHFAEVTAEQFRENNRRFNPHLFSSDSTEAPTEKAEIAGNLVGEKIPVPHVKELPQSATAVGGEAASKNDKP